MSMNDLVAQAGEAIAILLVTVEAVRSVSRRPTGSEPAFTSSPVRLVETVDRRESELAFVGMDRRQPGSGKVTVGESVQRAA